MREANPHLTGVERTFSADELIVSKTDLKGHITYANRLFCELADFDEATLIGAAHSIVRHPDMPRCVFKLLWDTLAAGKEIFAYVVNKSGNGDHYWVLAHVTPSFGPDGKVVGYHSNRRLPSRAVLTQHIIPLYASLRKVEAAHQNPREALEAGTAAVHALLKEKGVTYDEFIFSLINAG